MRASSSLYKTEFGRPHLARPKNWPMPLNALTTWSWSSQSMKVGASRALRLWRASLTRTWSQTCLWVVKTRPFSSQTTSESDGSSSVISNSTILKTSPTTLWMKIYPSSNRKTGRNSPSNSATISATLFITAVRATRKRKSSIALTRSTTISSPRHPLIKMSKRPSIVRRGATSRVPHNISHPSHRTHKIGTTGGITMDKRSISRSNPNGSRPLISLRKVNNNNSSIIKNNK